MSAKKTAPATPKPLSLDEQAKDLHEQIAKNEDKAAPLYLRLGGVLVKIKAEHKWDWKQLLAHATDDKKGLGLRRSRVVRALRIHKFYHSQPEKLNGLTLYEALAHEPKDKEGRQPQPVGSPLTGQEYQAAARYEKAVGTRERAVEVLTRIFINGEKPVKSCKSGTGWQAAWEEIKSHRDRLRKSGGDLYHIWNQMSVTHGELPSYKDVKADPVAAMERFRSIMQHCFTEVAAEHHEAEAGLLVDMAKIMGEAAKTVAGMVDTEAGVAVEQPAPVSVSSAN